MSNKTKRFTARVREDYFDPAQDYLGHGDTGQVYRAFRNKDLKAPFALKIIKKARLEKNLPERQLLREM